MKFEDVDVADGKSGLLANLRGGVSWTEQKLVLGILGDEHVRVDDGLRCQSHFFRLGLAHNESGASAVSL